MDVDVIENGLPPERRRPRGQLILSRLAIGAVLIGGVTFAGIQHNEATRPPSSQPHPQDPTSTPDNASPERVIVDQRPNRELPPGLQDKAIRLLGAGTGAAAGTIDLRGSDAFGGVGSVGVFNLSATGRGRVDLICLGVGQISVSVEAQTPDAPGLAGTRSMNCADGAVNSIKVTTAGHGIHVYAQLDPDTVAVLAYAYILDVS